MIPIFLLNFILPMALSAIRSYLYSPSNNMDSQLLDTVKQSVAYLATQDTNTVNFGHVATLNTTSIISSQNQGV
jgi:hypothetical protein